jgi:CBS domain-containing protein
MQGQNLSRRPNFVSRLSIRTRVDSMWYLAIILIAGIMVTQFPQEYPLWQRVVAGVAGSSLFLASMIINRMVFNIIALMFGIPLRNVTLFVFGEVAQVPEDGTRPSMEAIMGAVALFLNIIMAGIFNWIFLGRWDVGNILVLDVLRWLAFLSYMLVLFHLIPVFPLAGSRILAAIIWKATGNYLRAIRTVTMLGWGFGLVLILSGVMLLVVSRQLENGLLLTFFGWAVQKGATLGRNRAILLAALQSIKAKDIISEDFAAISIDNNLGQVVRDYILLSGQDYFAVTEEGRLLGIMTSRNMKRVNKSRWESTPVGRIMTPSRAVSTVQGDLPASHLLEQMDQFRVDSIPVLEKDRLIGIVVREKLIRLAKIRAQLKI